MGLLVIVVHKRSDASVGATDSHSSVVHFVSAVHVSAVGAGEKVAWSAQGAHWRSAVLVPSVTSPEPVGHTCHAAHERWPAIMV